MSIDAPFCRLKKKIAIRPLHFFLMIWCNKKNNVKIDRERTKEIAGLIVCQHVFSTFQIMRKMHGCKDFLMVIFFFFFFFI